MERRQETRGAGRAAGGSMDLHTHSACSDGDRAPAALVESAAQSGVGLLALTDHDSVRGVPEAVAAGRRLGLPVVPGVEMSNEFPQELHILGLAWMWKTRPFWRSWRRRRSAGARAAG